MEFYWHNGGILPLILSKFTACFLELFRWNTTQFGRKKPGFFWNFCGILMELLLYFPEIEWYFHGILVVFWCNILGIFRDFTSQIAMAKTLLTELNGILVEYFMNFWLRYVKEEWKKLVLTKFNWYFDGIFTLLTLL